MRALRLVAAIAYGFVLFYFVWVWFGGFMAARQIPSSFFKLVGQENALALISFGFHFVPTVSLLLLCTLLFAVPFKSQAPLVARTVVAGAVISYVFWLLLFTLQGTQDGAPLPAHFVAQFQVPWWAWPALAAPFTAFALAYVAAPKLLPSASEA